jgi:hypothetical protein
MGLDRCTKPQFEAKGNKKGVWDLQIYNQMLHRHSFIPIILQLSKLKLGRLHVGWGVCMLAMGGPALSATVRGMY